MSLKYDIHMIFTIFTFLNTLYRLIHLMFTIHLQRRKGSILRNLKLKKKNQDLISKWISVSGNGGLGSFDQASCLGQLEQLS